MLISGQKPDSVVVEVTASYKGAPLTNLPLNWTSRCSDKGDDRDSLIHVVVSRVAVARYTGVSVLETRPSMMTTGGLRNSAPGTLNQLFLTAVEKQRRPDALQVKRDGRYQPISHDTLLERRPPPEPRARARGARRSFRGSRRDSLRELPSPSWAIVDYAALALGAADVPIYPKFPADQVCYILC